MEPWSRAVDRSIRAVSAGPVVEEHVPVLLWVHSGSATVEVAGTIHRISAGEAIWIPPGVVHRTVTDEGGVVLPIFPLGMSELLGAAMDVRTVAIPRAWDEWLVYQFDFNSHHSIEARSGGRALFELVAGSPLLRGDPQPITGVPPLPMPRSREARTVAQTLLRSPGSPLPAEYFASRENISVRTLQRQFVNETGMVFSAWRSRVRVTAAAGHLADGHDVGWAGRRVGYATPAGFTRAFHRHLGIGPREYSRRTHVVGSPASADPDEPSARLVALSDPRPPDAPPIPARRVWNWVYDWHVLWWAYCGAAVVRIGAREFAVAQGHAIWLPAGFSASVVLEEGSVLLPLGNRYGGAPIGVDELGSFSLADESVAFLLHTVLAEYTLFQPDLDHPRLVDELFRTQFLSVREGSSNVRFTGAVSTIARALRREPADSRSLDEWAALLRLSPREVGDEFRTQTGTSFPRWRGQLRMSLARELLMHGDPPHQVSALLGYATPAVFSKVFATAHGLTPRAFQRRVSRAPAGD